MRLLGRGRRRSYNYRSKHHDILLLPSDTAHAQGRNCRYWAPSSMLVTARFHSVSIISIFAKHAFPTCSARDPGLQKYRGPFTLLQFRPLHFMWPFLCLSCLAAQEIMQAPQLASRLTLHTFGGIGGYHHSSSKGSSNKAHRSGGLRSHRAVLRRRLRVTWRSAIVKVQCDELV